MALARKLMLLCIVPLLEAITPAVAQTPETTGRFYRAALAKTALEECIQSSIESDVSVDYLNAERAVEMALNSCSALPERFAIG